MIPTIRHWVDCPCTRQEQEALFRLGHVEDLELGGHSDGRSTAINAFRPTTELRRTSIPTSTPSGRFHLVLIANHPDSYTLEALSPHSRSL
jgi:hypothetical protein